MKNKCDLHEIAMVVASSIMYILYLGLTLLRLLLWLLDSFYLIDCRIHLVFRPHIK